MDRIETLKQLITNSEKMIDELTVLNQDSNWKKLAQDDLVHAVLSGSYGSGPERKEELEKDGHSYNEVQANVNNYIVGSLSAVKAIAGVVFMIDKLVAELHLSSEVIGELEALSAEEYKDLQND